MNIEVRKDAAAYRVARTSFKTDNRVATWCQLQEKVAVFSQGNVRPLPGIIRGEESGEKKGRAESISFPLPV